MSIQERADRLKIARERAGFDSPRAAARHFRWNENTYKSREGGLRDYDVDEARPYGRAFNVSWIWLLSGEGGMDRQSTARIEGLIGAGGEIDMNVSQAYGEECVEVEVLMPLPPDVSAWEVWGDSMLPKYDPGDVILVRNAAVPPDLLLGQVALVLTEGGKRFLKRIERGSSDGVYNLDSFNARTMADQRILLAGAIHVVVPSAQVQRISGEKEIARRHRAALKSA